MTTRTLPVISALAYGKPLAVPSKQTLLPVIDGEAASILGFLTIAETTFDGTETEFVFPDGETPLPITTCTVPYRGTTIDQYRVSQYVAVVLTHSEVYNKAWGGNSAFIAMSDTGYLFRHYMPTIGWTSILTRGSLVQSLVVGMATGAPAMPSPTPPDAQPGTAQWQAPMPQFDAAMACPFFDFLWTDLFGLTSSSVPLRLDVISNPPGGEFKTTLIPIPVVDVATGGPMFNTIRIIRLKPAVPGVYEFNYAITDTLGQTTPVVFSLYVDTPIPPPV